MKVRLFIALLFFCEESDNGVKAILLYKISVILLKNKSSVKALLLYKILVNVFKIFVFLYKALKWEPTGFSKKHETMQDISENPTFSGYSQLFGSPSGQFGALFQQRRQCGFVK